MELSSAVAKTAGKQLCDWTLHISIHSSLALCQQFSHPSEHPSHLRDLSKPRLLCPKARVFNSVDLEWGLSICISNQLWVLQDLTWRTPYCDIWENGAPSCRTAAKSQKRSPSLFPIRGEKGAALSKICSPVPHSTQG
jgi:hypothetical protein